MFRRMLALMLALVAAVPLLWRFVGRPWPDQLLGFGELTLVAQFEPERLVGGAVVALAWAMWLLLAVYAVSGMVSAVASAFSDPQVDRG